MNHLYHIFSVVICVCIYLSLVMASPKPLRFNTSGQFKISQFADLHYGENENSTWGPGQDKMSMIVQMKVLSSEKPDFVVYTGDQITGNNIGAEVENATSYWAECVQPSINANTSFATIFGNHDSAPLDKVYLSDHQLRSLTLRRQILQYEMDTFNGLSQTRLGNINATQGANYYYLTVGNDNCKGCEDRPVALLLFLDTGGGSYDEIMYEDQIHWVNSTLHQFSDIPAVIFLHIPTPDYSSNSRTRCFGMAEDGITPFSSDISLLSVLSSFHNVVSLNCGHDHGNSNCCLYENIWLCFGRHSGYGGYGTWAHGARIINLELKTDIVTIETWIRMEDNSVTDRNSIWPIGQK